MTDETVDLGIDDLADAVEVGAGGFGTVYKARQESLRRDVAVKMVANTVKDRKVRIRFEREIQAMGMLSGHPNIVTVYDSGFTAGGQPYILMDFMDQGSLGDRLHDKGPVPYADVLQIMVKVCGALETAHQAGILHRDLKPENILVSAYGEPKLGDFGIARLKGGPETGTSSLTASIEHVAPELLEAKPPDAASDLYALGSTMFKLLTGEAAFVHKTDESIVPALARIRDQPVPDLRQRGIPPPVATVVELAMAKTRAERFTSAAEMGQAAQNAQRSLGLMPTSLPIREDDAAAARESTRSLNSDDIASSIDDIRRQGGNWQTNSGPTGPQVPKTSGPTGHPHQTGQPYQTGHPPQSGQPPPSGPPPQGYAGPPGYPQDQPNSGPVVQPQGFTGPGYRPPPGQQGRPVTAGAPWGKIAAGVGALVVVAAIGTAVALRGGGTPDPEPSPSEVVTQDTTDVPSEYAAYERLTDDEDQITIDVPRPWNDVDRSPWVIDGDEVGNQIKASPDIDAFRSSWDQPGLIFGASEALTERFDPAQLLDAVSFAQQCTYDGREDYSDPAYMGFRDNYSSCGGTDTTYTVVAAEPAAGDQILLLQFQGVLPRDNAALQKALMTFFVLVPESSESPAALLPTASPEPSESE